VIFGHFHPLVGFDAVLAEILLAFFAHLFGNVLIVTTLKEIAKTVKVNRFYIGFVEISQSNNIELRILFNLLGFIRNILETSHAFYWSL
jgi:hypothetical protein